MKKKLVLLLFVCLGLVPIVRWLLIPFGADSAKILCKGWSGDEIKKWQGLQNKLEELKKKKASEQDIEKLEDEIDDLENEHGGPPFITKTEIMLDEADKKALTETGVALLQGVAKEKNKIAAVNAFWKNLTSKAIYKDIKAKLIEKLKAGGSFKEDFGDFIQKIIVAGKSGSYLSWLSKQPEDHDFFCRSSAQEFLNSLLSSGKTKKKFPKGSGVDVSKSSLKGSGVDVSKSPIYAGKSDKRTKPLFTEAETEKLGDKATAFESAIKDLFGDFSEWNSKDMKYFRVGFIGDWLKNKTQVAAALKKAGNVTAVLKNAKNKGITLYESAQGLIKESEVEQKRREAEQKRLKKEKEEQDRKDKTELQLTSSEANKLKPNVTAFQEAMKTGGEQLFLFWNTVMKKLDRIKLIEEWLEDIKKTQNEQLFTVFVEKVEKKLGKNILSKAKARSDRSILNAAKETTKTKSFKPKTGSQTGLNLQQQLAKKFGIKTSVAPIESLTQALAQLAQQK